MNKEMNKEMDDVSGRDNMIFATQDEAVRWSRYKFKKGFKKRSVSKAPLALQIDGNNPTIEQVLMRWWGINKTNPKRMVPLDDGSWMIYWDTSLAEEK